MTENFCSFLDIKEGKVIRAEEELSSPRPKESYPLPDGEELDIGNERFLAPEVCFEPQLFGLNF